MKVRMQIFLAMVILLVAATPVSAKEPFTRIVSLGPSITEMLFALGVGDQIVGVTKFCTTPEAAKEKQVVGGHIDKSIHLETLASLDADLVLVLRGLDSAILETLRAMVPRVEVIHTEGIDDIYTHFRFLGKLVNRSEEAEKLVEGLQQEIADVEATLATLEDAERPRVFYQVWDEPLMTTSARTFIGQLIELAGGRNIFADLSGDYMQISTEDVIARNPQALMGPDHHGKRMEPKHVAARPGWSGLDAVQNNRIYLVDGDLVSRPGPRVGEALRHIAGLLHPDRFASEDAADD